MLRVSRYIKLSYFHRVFDGQTITLCPVPGLLIRDGQIVGFVVVSWEPRDLESPVQF